MNFLILLLIFLSALIIEVCANFTNNFSLQSFSKPSLMIILFFYYSINTKKLSSLKFLIFAALFFSWLGDIFLLLNKMYKSFFLYGLIAFLIAHIFYIFYFWKIRKFNKIENLPNTLVFIAIATYSLALFGFIAPNVKNLVVPIGIYALVISTMLGVSLTAFDFKKHAFGKLCIAGTTLFVVSDSILAINRFVSPFEFAPILVMLTYAVAQLLIVEGSLRNLKATEDAEFLEKIN